MFVSSERAEILETAEAVIEVEALERMAGWSKAWRRSSRISDLRSSSVFAGSRRARRNFAEIGRDVTHDVAHETRHCE